MIFYLACNDLGVQRATGFVDIAPIRTGVRDDDLATQIRKELRSDSRRGTVRAIEDNSASIEREPWNSGEQETNILSAVGLVDHRRNGLLRSRGQTGELAEDLLLDGEFHSVGKFVTIGTE